MSENVPLMTLEEIRDRLDLGDSQMLEWLATRANLVREVARIKDAKGASLQAADREASMFAKKQIQCRVLGLDFDYISEIVSLMIWHSKQIECEELGRDTFMDTEPVSPGILRQQLLTLAAGEASRYDEFCRGKDAETIASYLDRELVWIGQACAGFQGKGIALDLGCATGQAAKVLATCFDTVHGYDISPDMIEHARANGTDTINFEVRDLDGGIPAGDNSVSVAVANFGAASELQADLLEELNRVLIPGGRAFLSYYNRDALVNHWIYPWPATIHSHLNPHNDTLEVWSGDSVYTIRARAETCAGVGEKISQAGMSAQICETYPTLQPILPNFIVHNPRAREVFNIGRELDAHLADANIARGTYIMAIATKPG
jgi:chorismate mutase/predicted RNA methylase